MQLGLWFRERFTGQLGQSILQELDQLVAAIQTGWNAQHDADGSHRDVTATRVRCGGFGVTVVHTYTFADVTQTVIEIPAGVSFVEFLVPQALGGRVTLRGIIQSGVRPGDMLWLRSAPNTVFSTTLRSAGYTSDGIAPINTELSFPAHQASAADARLFEMVGLTNGYEFWVPFIYTTRQGGGGTTIGAWLMLMTMSGV